MASTDKPWSADPNAAGNHPAHASPSDQTDAATEAANIHRGTPERAPQRPQTRSEYIENVLAQIKDSAK